jgi:hypothetical protein
MNTIQKCVDLASKSECGHLMDISIVIKGTWHHLCINDRFCMEKSRRCKIKYRCIEDCDRPTYYQTIDYCKRHSQKMVRSILKTNKDNLYRMWLAKDMLQCDVFGYLVGEFLVPVLGYLPRIRQI